MDISARIDTTPASIDVKPNSLGDLHLVMASVFFGEFDKRMIRNSLIAWLTPAQARELSQKLASAADAATELAAGVQE